MKILLFGAGGQLGVEVIERARALNFELICPVSSEVNVADLEQVKRIVEVSNPDLIINSAAYTAVDDAESAREDAFLTNEKGAFNVAAAAHQSGARHFYISTDYVFSGNGVEGEYRPYREDDKTEPLSVYGASKLAGERAVLEEYGERSLVVRTSSLFGKRGPNFVQTMLNLFDSGREVRVVSDQTMSPTWAGFTAEVLLDVARIDDVRGILHVSCGGSASWYEFAREILLMSSGRNSEASVVPTTSEEFVRPAPRPHYSVLSLDRLTDVLGRTPMTWRKGLEGYLRDVGRLLEEKE